jgi:hypothetical protein
MDEIVKAAMAKWPNVPHCFGWLALDARGQWFMRDDRIQAAGPFPAVKGSRIDHDKLLAFIHRNYGCDEAGCWYFQNGPQRVYVELEVTPWVWRLELSAPQNTLHVSAHTGFEPSQIESVLLDELGRLYLNTEIGLGIVHSLDMHAAANAIENGALKAPLEVGSADLRRQHRYVLSPQAWSRGAA